MLTRQNSSIRKSWLGRYSLTTGLKPHGVGVVVVVIIIIIIIITVVIY
jgi:hypothetical protein